MVSVCLSLVKDVRAYAYATEESWVIAIDQEKGDLLLESLSYRCFGSCPVGLLTGVVPWPAWA